MIVDTRRLFARLLSKLQINVVCDVGSMDGADALYFRHAVPDSDIFAFEPNPHNFRRMLANDELAAHHIHLLPLAASNHDGEAEFYLVDDGESPISAIRGMSSLYRRSNQYSPAAVVSVRTARLDRLMADKSPPGGSLALWVDTEGKAHEVIDGSRGIAAQVALMHVEVETVACINSEQKLYAEVVALCDQLGFVAVATDQPSHAPQFNVLFVRRALIARLRLRMGAWLASAWLRYRLFRLARRICPECLRRYEARRSAGRGRSGHRFAVDASGIAEAQPPPSAL